MLGVTTLMRCTALALAGDDGGVPAVAFLENFQQVMTGLWCERLETPVIEDKDVNAGEGAEQTAIAAVATGHGEIAEQLGDALIEDGVIIAACFLAER